MSKPTRGNPSLPNLLCVFLLTFGAIACTGEDATTLDTDARTQAQTEATAASTSGGDASASDAHDHSAHAPPAKNAASKGENAARHPSERPIPAFDGVTLAGTRLAMGDLLGARVLLFFFNPEVANATPVSLAVNDLVGEASDQNFRIVGVGVGSNAGKLSRFAKDQGLDFPVIDDSAGTITQRIRLTAPIALLGVDAEGYMSFGMAGFPETGDVRAFTDKELRNRLRLSDAVSQGEGELFSYIQAPELGVVSMSGGETLETQELAGRAAIVIFFLHTCPHCHRALEAIKEILASIPEQQKPRLVAVSVQNSPAAIRASLKDLGLDFFDPYLDPSGKAAERWGVTGGVPVVNVVDAQGRIRHRSEGWDGQRDGGMLRMHAASAAGTRVPMLLDPKGYSGNDACGVCHAQQFATWQYTKHASAFNTLIAHAADRRADCIGCHVVGFEETGGYDFYRRPAHLENVGCESCHGRGGPHLSPAFVPKGKDAKPDYAPVCASCHNPTHSLGFDFATFHPQVSHTRIASLSNRERGELLEGGPSRELLPTAADYVGSEACQSCHKAEFATWKASPHGHAVATLAKAGKAGEADCLQCHTTAYGRPGGFSPSASVSSQSDLARVGCESCHGPGGQHIGENARRVGTILSLGDKCDSCVILKVCGTCHDDANDPGFQFKVERRIDDQRHGTIESAATRAGNSAFLAPKHSLQPSQAPHASGQAPARILLVGVPQSTDGDRARLHAAFDHLRVRAGSDAATARLSLPDAS